MKKLSDEVIIESVVAFSNADGRNFYLGVEDDGEITGLHPAHKNSSGLAAFIANKTVPPVAVEVENYNNYLMVTVRKSRCIVATSSGKILRRRLKTDGEPENVPMYPHEINTRLSTLNMLDYTALPVPDAVYDDLDDEELDKALRLAVNTDNKIVPTYCGLLLIGKK